MNIVQIGDGYVAFARESSVTATYLCYGDGKIPCHKFLPRANIGEGIFIEKVKIGYDATLIDTTFIIGDKGGELFCCAPIASRYHTFFLYLVFIGCSRT